MKQQPVPLNKFHQKIGSAADKTTTTQQTRVPWQWAVKQRIQAKKIRSSSGDFNHLSGSTSGSINITNGTITSSLFNKGSITNSVFQGTLSQPVSQGGTFTNPIVTTGTFNTSLFGGTFNNGVLGTPSVSGGTFNNGVLGTPSVSGGTVNADLYETGGISGVSGSIVYLKTTGPTYGTLSFTNGIITSFN